MDIILTILFLGGLTLITFAGIIVYDSVKEIIGPF